MTEFPSFSEIKKNIPEHCFEPNSQTSLYYVLRIIVLSLCAAVCFHKIGQDYWLVNILYACVQGTLFWGIFTIGHDCGHGSFSKYPTLNFVVGLLMHSFILTPYEAWRLSHKSHHANTCNSDKDEIFYPKPHWLHKFLLLFTFGGAWFTYLLISNTPGRKNPTEYFTNKQFRPYVNPIIISFTSIGLMIGLLVWIAHLYTLNRLLLFYGYPLFVFGCWLVFSTFLHHHGEECPWYDKEDWSPIKGTLSCVDRDYGLILNNVTHSINLHQIHHLFPAIPHYHLYEATMALREKYPQYVRMAHGSNVVDFVIEAWRWIVG